MPARSTMLTGQYVRTHGVVANGVPLPDDAPSVAAYLRDDGRLPHRAARQGALRARLRPPAAVGREPHGGARASPVRTAASSTPSSRCTCPTFGKRALQHYGRWLIDTTASRRRRASRRCSRPSPAATPARPRRASTRSRASWYHTDWVADRTIAYLDSLPDDADWFVWMSFPDPHHPWDPPASRSSTAATGATSTCRPAIPAANEKIERGAGAEARALARAVGGHVRQRRRRARHVPPAEASATTTSARSTR